MTHYKKLLDPGTFLGPQDFPADKTVVISRVVREKMPAKGEEEAKEAAVLYIKSADGSEYPRFYKLPKSVLYGLSLELGPDIDAWPGKSIVMFAAKCMSFGEVEECVRIRFSAENEAKVKKWMKKRGASVAAYILKEA